jgi:hypothetical protein
MSNEGWIYIGLRFFLHHGAENYAFRPRDEPEPDKTASDQEYGDGSGVPFSAVPPLATTPLSPKCATSDIGWN